ncbi:unnamed protein product, partial [Oikopleura dioica]
FWAGDDDVFEDVSL